MRIFGGTEQQPTSAERVRTILASAHSMTMETDGRSIEVSRGTGPGATQHVHLHPSPADAGLTGAAGAGERVPATLKFTDIAPLPVRDRVRARVTVMGWLTSRDKAASPAGDCMEFATAVLETATCKAGIGLDDLMAAPADPLATYEADILTHLVEEHSHYIPLLLRLVEPRFLQLMERVVPLAIDRYGISLRVEYPVGHHDVRLPFHKTLTDADQFSVQLQALLTTARRCSHGGRLLSEERGPGKNAISRRG
ncbi:DUF2470 domain-containing protein [Streptomyces sp. bgisy084]|uniref:DUF2470 domain-containing protein n=1 Tax=unclassified Streptomyces TaxID=2593676 RepID=UPI003D75A352